MTEINKYSEQTNRSGADAQQLDADIEPTVPGDYASVDNDPEESDLEEDELGDIDDGSDESDEDDDLLYMDGDDDEASGQLDDTDSESRARFVAAAADSLRASDITVLDLRGLTIIADFFVVCTGKSSIQIRGIADRIEERMREEGFRKLRVEGYQEATWILLDYGDVVAHVMAEEQRDFYRLEQFWQSAPRLDLELDPETTTIG